MRTCYAKRVAIAATLLGSIGTAGAAPVFPSPIPGVNSLLFGDFTVYSLAFLNNLTNSTNFNVQSSPGQIQDFIVPLAGSNGANILNNGPNIDPARPAPSGGGGEFFFSTKVTTDTAGDFTGDVSTSWDARTSALRTALGSQKLVIYFDFNETGNPGLTGVDLLAWAKVTVKDDQGILPTKTFYLTSDKAASIANDAPEPDPTKPGFDVNDSRWVYIHNEICVNATSGAFLHFDACTGADVNAKTVTQGLGTNLAEFAIYNQELNDLVNNPDYDVLQAEFPLTKMNGGGPQIFLLPTTIAAIPEPTALALFGVGLVGVGLVAAGTRTRRRKN